MADSQMNRNRDRDQGEISVPCLALIRPYLDIAVLSPPTRKRMLINWSELRVDDGAGAGVL